MGRTRISISLKRLQSRWVSHHCNKQTFRPGHISLSTLLDPWILPPSKPWTPGCPGPGLCSIADTRSARHSIWNMEKTSRKPENKHHVFRMNTIGGKRKRNQTLVQYTELITERNGICLWFCTNVWQTSQNRQGWSEGRVPTKLFSPYSLQDKISWTYLLLPFPKRTTLDRRKTIDNLPPSGCRVMFCSVWMTLVTLVNPLRISEGLRGCRDCLASCK